MTAQITTTNSVFPLGFGLNLLFVKSLGLEESWAPINFFDIKQSTSNVLTAFSASTAPASLLDLVPTADSFRIRITNQRLGVIDTWGELSIPGGTFNALRKKQTENYLSFSERCVQGSHSHLHAQYSAKRSNRCSI